MTETATPTRNIPADARNSRPALSGLALTRQTSLSMRKSLALDDWLRVGLHIVRISESSTWWLADWLIYGRSHYPDRYKRAIERTSLDYQTLRNYAWVAGRVGAERRRAGLSFQHHAEVAPLSGTDQEKWLEKAERLGWSRNRLRAEIRMSTRAGRAPKIMNFRIEDEHVRLWQAAADREQEDLRQWMVEVLNRAAVVACDQPA